MSKTNITHIENISAKSGNQEEFIKTLKKQKNDSLCKILYNREAKISVSEPTEILDDQGVSLGSYYLEDIFHHLKQNYPFIVTVPVEYEDFIIGKGKMIPVCPSDEPGRYGFKGTIGRNPYLTPNEKRYIIQIKEKHLDKLLPHLTGNQNSFRGVGFLPYEQGLELKRGEDYEVLGRYSSETLEQEQEKHISGKVVSITHLIKQQTEDMIQQRTVA